MAEEYVDVPIDGEIVKELMKLTKAELVKKFIIVTLEGRIASKEVKRLQDKITIAESYVEQGRAMIEAVMERWHEYDV